MKKSVWLLMSVLVIFTFITYSFFFASRITHPSGVVYYVRPGLSAAAFVRELENQAIIENAWVSKIIAYFYEHRLKTGEYLFPPGATQYRIWQQVTGGKGLYFRSFTIVPGWSFKKLRQSLIETATLEHASKFLDDPGIMAKMGAPTLSPEGQFYPETYRYARGITDMVILKEAYQLMQRKLEALWSNHAADLPYQTSYEALIAASLIEKEAHYDDERPLIAGVIVNRLRKGMRLQVDPTVIYGLGDRYQGVIHKKDLREDTQFNTYLHKGLPPTPIAIPSESSLQAAANPKSHDYYYFVALNSGGRHYFSKTLDEHERMVKKVFPKHSYYMNHEKLTRYIQMALKMS